MCYPQEVIKSLHFVFKSRYAFWMINKLASLCSLCLCLPAFAQAQMTDVSCDNSARMMRTLSEILGAERQGTGLRDPDTMIEVWVTRHSGDWMIVQTYANGTSCIVAMGEHWEAPLPEPA